MPKGLLWTRLGLDPDAVQKMLIAAFISWLTSEKFNYVASPPMGQIKKGVK
ncbi:MAG: hypothetical protein ACYC0Q_05965 [Eubacteriales bacterium]